VPAGAQDRDQSLGGWRSPRAASGTVPGLLSVRGWPALGRQNAAHAIRKWVSRLTVNLDRLASQVEAQGATLTEALQAGPKAKAPTWVGLEQADHDAQLAELTEWVDGILRPSYPGSAPAPCWPSHWQAVWELSTLAAEWRRVYQRKVPELAGALDFHDRWLPGVARRVAEVQRSCTPERCMAAPEVRQQDLPLAPHERQTAYCASLLMETRHSF
jgi:hypothetical protein